MRRLALTALLFALTGCGVSNPDAETTEPSEWRHQPIESVPGLRVSGDIRIGVVKRL